MVKRFVLVFAVLCCLSAHLAFARVQTSSNQVWIYLDCVGVFGASCGSGIPVPSNAAGLPAALAAVQLSGDVAWGPGGTTAYLAGNSGSIFSFGCIEAGTYDFGSCVQYVLSAADCSGLPGGVLSSDKFTCDDGVAAAPVTVDFDASAVSAIGVAGMGGISGVVPGFNATNFAGVFLGFCGIVLSFYLIAWSIRVVLDLVKR